MVGEPRGGVESVKASDFPTRKKGYGIMDIWMAYGMYGSNGWEI